ncbi:MAG: electron transfer flavoprotein subunit alpha/FixB family protein, partial [Alphaproteobacteria bacterium]|nr:electron transfer flavoprotein subunit alpha/FixB family protein [Alphaproteobacteria bacterium]
MAVLVIAEHDNQSLKAATLNTVAAAQQISDKGAGDIIILVAGSGCAGVGDAAAKIAGVSKVLVAEDSGLEHGLAENMAALVTGLANNFSHILAPATTFGKNFMPRVAALLDVQQISEISAVEDADTFVRPIYAGNAMATVKSADATKVITVRATTFDPAAADGGSAGTETIAAVADKGVATFIELAESGGDR